MVRVVPLPRRRALEIILEDPTESLDVRLDDAGGKMTLGENMGERMGDED